MNMKVITHNPGKVREYACALEEYGIVMEHLNMEYDEIQTDRVEEVVRNGLAHLYSQKYNNFMIDDTGLFIRCLKGFPGAWSAYVQNTIGNQGILKLMENAVDRQAEFRCCIGCCIDGEQIEVTGVCPGTILNEEQGKDGFGYDPIFSPDGKRSFSEMSVEEKNGISHRGKATALLIETLRTKGFISR